MCTQTSERGGAGVRRPLCAGASCDDRVLLGPPDMRRRSITRFSMQLVRRRARAGERVLEDLLLFSLLPLRPVLAGLPTWSWVSCFFFNAFRIGFRLCEHFSAS